MEILIYGLLAWWTIGILGSIVGLIEACINYQKLTVKDLAIAVLLSFFGLLCLFICACELFDTLGISRSLKRLGDCVVWEKKDSK